MKAAAAGILALSATLAAFQEGPSRVSGPYEVTLRLPPDGVYAQEELQFEFRVADKRTIDPVFGAAPVVRARIQAVFAMPTMPAMPRQEIPAHAEGVAGDYGVHPTFPHGGNYQMELMVEPLGEPAFQVAFPIAVEDAYTGKNRKPAPPPFSVELKTNPKSVKAEEAVDLELTVRHRDRPKEAVRDFDIQHEKKLHLLVVRTDLGEFSHQHPELDADGVFRLRGFRFPSAGDYTLFADVAPRGTGAKVLLMKLKVSGKKGSPFRLNTSDRRSVRQVESLLVESSTTQAPCRKTVNLGFLLKDAGTAAPPAALEPYLGAMGHLILVHEDGVTFVHSHPDERTADPRSTGKIDFMARFPRPGFYRGWAQFQNGGKVLTADFVFEAVE